MTIRSYFRYYKTELLFFFGFLTILGIAFFIQSVYVDTMWSTSNEQPTTDLVINIFVDRVIAAYLWLFLTPFIIIVAEKISGKNFGFPAMISLHIAAGIFFTFVHISIYSSYTFIAHSIIPWMYATVIPADQSSSFGKYVLSSFGRLNHVYRLLYYCILIAIHFAFDYFRKYSEREVRASQLEVQLKEAQLRTLYQQLQPHFLFNTLNGISSLMYKSIDDADKVLTYLGDLLRISLERMNVQDVRLKDDIAFIDRYLLIEKTRMGKRMTVTTDFQPETLDAYVPCMIMQPIVENAIKHGISPFVKEGQITLSSWREGEKLVIQVEDSGSGLEGTVDEKLHNGYGIKNTIERLTHLYSSDFSLDFSNRKEGGLRVTLSIPFRMHSE